MRLRSTQPARSLGLDRRLPGEIAQARAILAAARPGIRTGGRDRPAPLPAKSF
ncbi:hypothetical protein L522_2443 [Bordetella bronchiseptica MBORD707]|nr:hypothetical protein L492_2368 [Bordetella bronchiseptica 7E71]KDD14207.1 hypothetical protein L522_2443 [Bordetella bronchiseptica MBORD707]